MSENNCQDECCKLHQYSPAKFTHFPKIYHQQDKNRVGEFYHRFPRYIYFVVD